MYALVVAVGCATGTNPLGEPQDGGPDSKLPADAKATPDAVVLPTAADACVASATERLANPVLDLTPAGTGWVDQRDPLTNALPGGPFPIISANPVGLTSQTAPNKAWLGGAAGDDVTPAASSLTDQLYQDVTFPADATNFVVSGYYVVGTTDLDTFVFDTFTLAVVETNGAAIETVLSLDNTTIADDFTQFSKTLTSNLAGRTVRLRATSVNDDILHTNFFLDSLSFTATSCQ